MTDWELGNRRYIREKVVASYEQIFSEPAGRSAYASPPDEVWSTLFLLKVNRLWLRQQIIGMTEEQIMGPRKALFRDVFARCISHLESEDTEACAHALETLGAVLSTLGHKSFPDPGSDTLELFCGIQTVEAVMGGLLGSLGNLLASRDAGRVHAALTCALSIGCLSTNANHNILLEFLVSEELAEQIFGVLYGADPEIDSPPLREQALKLVVLLASYQKYESRNPFRRRLHACSSAASVGRALGQSAALLAGAQAGPSAPELSAASVASVASSVSGTLLWAFQRSLEVLTLDDLVPGGAASGSLDSSAESACKSELLAAALNAYEVVCGNPAAYGTAFFSLLPAADANANGRGKEAGKEGATEGKLSNGHASSTHGNGGSEHGDAGAGATLSAPGTDRETAHCATLRHLITAATLGALEARRPGAVALTRLCTLALLSAASDDKFLEAAHARSLGGDLPLWRVERGVAVLRRTTRHATLASALVEMVTLTLSQNLRRVVPADAFHSALLLAHRLMLWQRAAEVKLADANWRPLWLAVVGSLLHCATNSDIPDGDSPGGWLGVCLQHMSVVNMVLVHGASFLPEAALQQQFAYEIVRRHREFERLFKEGKRRDRSGRLVAALALVRRIIVLTLDKLEAPSGPSHSQADVMGALRELQLEVQPQMAASLHRWQLPPENPTNVPFFQSVSRLLISGFRADSTLEFLGAQ
ncbi:hypothetical protein T492DRAFT_957007 [Pavlovales sp. CCMP2436]|nr:hypothetical protein T492DRAFT_957007 [Pavlovales sp. CCMP2436]|mmetsp:Transcript_22259/g.56425  ORF Transcript_22259/g.56425 Transcript_22259/m.56425 type:complete len:707 (-) Transcript_22259:154-2274(-)